uniref:Uncharacterized protein n=1 Tax=Tanacetum cinerariifolium TaxID=118510 RepID=A0A6L2L4M6_TANCI|nr:hypothetical protein [Tanacetum cinerariifolium]
MRFRTYLLQQAVGMITKYFGLWKFRKVDKNVDMAPLPPRDQRHPWLRYQVDGYTEDIMHTFEQRLETIFGRRLFKIRGPLVQEFILEFLSTCMMSDTEMGLDVTDTLCFHLGGARRRMTWRQFILALGFHTADEMAKDAPFYVYIRDPMRRLCNRMISLAFLVEDRHLRRHTKGRKSGARLSRGHSIGCLAAYFCLVSNEGLTGLLVITHELLMIDLHELARLNISVRLGDTHHNHLLLLPRLGPCLRGFQGLRKSFMTQLMDASGCTYQAFDTTLVDSSQVPYQRRTRHRTDDANTSVT